jgi:hypothetical protein
MQLLLSLDYELFFGMQTGDPYHCLVEPVDALLSQLSRFPIKLSLFVDAGYLVTLHKEGRKYNQAAADFDTIKNHLSSLKEKGHDIQLHVHPHWIDSHYDGHRWHIETGRYKLHDFNQAEQDEIIHEYKRILTGIVGDSVFAFRGGGWCIQPWNKIASSLRKENIWLESTVFHRGRSEDQQRWYDFTAAPDRDFWKFDYDPVKVDSRGYFVEVPISSVAVNPLFFWKIALVKKMAGNRFKPFGNGYAMRADSSYYLRRLTRASMSVVSIDGLKSSLLTSALKKNLKRRPDMNLFHVMGHPKALTRYSIDQLKHFLDNNDFEYITYQDLGYLHDE